MKTIINEMLVTSINNSLPEGEKLVSFLMDLLNLSRESAYRRIRNEIPFTFEEVIAISLKLGLSLDEIAGQEQKNRAFFDLPVPKSADPLDVYSEIVDVAAEIYKKMQKSKESEIFFTANQLPFPYYMLYENLSKFYYYKWIHKTQEVPLNFYLSEFSPPSQVSTVHKRYRYAATKVNQVTAILCPSFILSTVKEIIYFYRRRLITKEELFLLQEDLYKVINKLENDTRKGVDENGVKTDLYCSTLNIASNSIWFRHDNETGTQFWTYTDPITVYNTEVSKRHKMWIDSLLKYSTLISQSNEIQRSEFFNKQNEYVKNIESLTL
ncbi:MAG: hypothetical protein ACK5KN_02255 [Dysgonomonas sp.]|nr:MULTISPECIES: hypothetical protein [Dysgonomonas]MBF0648924.1 hypothetical protein [Dysgonomonas sp. GY75]